jgi:hypothetical protein
MLRRYIAPALRELGFRRGPSLGAFRYETTAHAAEVRFIKSRHSTRQEVDCWVDLHATDLKTEWVYWDWTLRSLGPEPLGPLEVRAGVAVGPVASEVLRVFRGYGWPAIQVALDNPGYPRDPAFRWPRTFPKRPRVAARPSQTTYPASANPATATRHVKIDRHAGLHARA